MLRNLLKSSLCVLFFLSLSFSEGNLSFSYHNDNSNFYSLYGAGFNVDNEHYRYYITGEYYNSQLTNRASFFTGIDYNMSEKVVPFVFVNYFFNTRLKSDYVRTGVGAYYMLDEFIVKHRVSLAVVSETNRGSSLLSWRYRAWQEFGNVEVKFIVNAIEHDISTRTEVKYLLSKEVKLSYVNSYFKSRLGKDISSTVGVEVRF